MADPLDVLAAVALVAAFGTWAIAVTIMAIWPKPPQEADDDDTYRD